MTEFHRFDDAIHDHGGAQSGSEPQEQHLAPLVTSQGLHRGIIDKLHWPLEGSREIETNPTGSKIVRLTDRSPSKNRAWVTNGYRIVLPIRRKFPHLGNHSFGSQRGSGIELPMRSLAG